ncbi:Peptidyl-prolyl cis-trans isomerase [Entamoeba marina]
MAELSNTPQYRDATAPSFTASGFDKETLPDLPEWQKPKSVKNKAKVQLETNFGNISMDIHCDLVPVLSENFLTLAESHYYDGTIFHRVIPQFMMQGGDPTNTGKGGTSCWGVELKDEFKPGLKHDSVGVVSMANHGRDTNGSQFFITFKEQPHLDKIHSVIGKVTDGFKVLKKIESVETNGNDNPLRNVILKEVIVEYNPFHHLDEESTKKQKWKDEQEFKELNKRSVNRWLSNPSGLPLNPLKKSMVIGKYLPASVQEKLTIHPPRKPSS